MSACLHPTKIRLLNVSVAIAPDGCLAGQQRQDFFSVPLQPFLLIEFCGNPVCELVLRQERLL